jgi:uncharacterized protein (TIGR01777 family)
LAGLSLSDGRWTPHRKQAFIDSRISAVKTLSLHKPTDKDLYFISASATGFYGSYPEKREVTEVSASGSDFLATLCAQWEASATSSSFNRIAIARIGIVLHPSQGAYPVMVKPLRWGAGATPGTGSQGISWIHIADLVRAFEWLMNQERQGIFNFTAPNPVSMQVFMEQAAKKYRRPLWPMHVNESILGMVLGEKAVLACQGIYAYPEALNESGFKFLHSSIDQALKSV